MKKKDAIALYDPLISFAYKKLASTWVYPRIFIDVWMNTFTCERFVVMTIARIIRYAFTILKRKHDGDVSIFSTVILYGPDKHSDW